ncbi:PREDICTED: uncharacterized protein LOC109163051 [Ipomoea nil]|uniref:uncharacterized protein LOC109163051 n=1 Tax=Ipomoea nil TaxID=35883 RepID=UPI0009013F30|nr:PREDICTED: uncharacterized protein LOC109163051 [Ipomoea nil]
MKEIINCKRAKARGRRVSWLLPSPEVAAATEPCRWKKSLSLSITANCSRSEPQSDLQQEFASHVEELQKNLQGAHKSSHFQMHGLCLDQKLHWSPKTAQFSVVVTGFLPCFEDYDPRDLIWV